MNQSPFKNEKINRNFELIIIGFIFMVLFLMPVIFTRVKNEISWLHVLKIWKDQFLLLPLFIVNHWLLAPKLMLRQKYFSYLISNVILISAFTLSYYYIDVILNVKPPVLSTVAASSRPTPIPPYAQLLIYSVLILGVDAGLLFSKKWYENEEKQVKLASKKSINNARIFFFIVSLYSNPRTLN